MWPRWKIFSIYSFPHVAQSSSTSRVILTWTWTWIYNSQPPDDCTFLLPSIHCCVFYGTVTLMRLLRWPSSRLHSDHLHSDHLHPAVYPSWKKKIIKVIFCSTWAISTIHWAGKDAAASVTAWCSCLRDSTSNLKFLEGAAVNLKTIDGACSSSQRRSRVILFYEWDPPMEDSEKWRVLLTASTFWIP